MSDTAVGLLRRSHVFLVLWVLAGDHRAGRALRSRLPLHTIMGGLRAGNTEPMRLKDKQYIRDAWKRVEATTGQPFDMGFLAREKFVYDTEPACRAVVTARRLMPNLTLPFMARVQQAFYAENRDMTDGR